MADHSDDTGKKKEPPKIKIGLGKELEKLEQDGPGDEKPTPKKQTARLEVPSGDAPAIDTPPQAKKGTSRIDISSAAPPPAKDLTTKIDLSQVEPVSPKQATTRIDSSQARPPAEKDLVTGKSSTSRISLADAAPPPPAEDPSTTMQVSDTDEGIHEAEIPDAAKNTTQRIVVDDDGAAEEIPLTGKEPLRGAAELKESKARTSRIELPTSVEEPDDDALKKRTAQVSPQDEGIREMPDEPQTAPRTVRLSRPATARTIVQPRTSPSASPDSSEAAKSATARLDLPPEPTGEAVTRPKTIRIKRPDGTSARKPLSIARASEEKKPVLSAVGSMDEHLEGDDVPGAAFVAVTTVALLVTGVLIYVLLAQTYALDLPFPGRL